MAEEEYSDLPRRVQRFYRREGERDTEKANSLLKQLKKQAASHPELSQNEERAKKLALRSIRHFREEYERYPSRKEYNEMAENIFEQLKTSESKDEPIGEKDIDHARKHRRHGRREKEGPKKETHETEEKQTTALPKELMGEGSPEDLGKDDDLSGMDIKDIFSDESSSDVKDTDSMKELETLLSMEEDAKKKKKEQTDSS